MRINNNSMYELKLCLLRLAPEKHKKRLLHAQICLRALLRALFVVAPNATNIGDQTSSPLLSRRQFCFWYYGLSTIIIIQKYLSPTFPQSLRVVAPSQSAYRTRTETARVCVHSRRGMSTPPSRVKAMLSTSSSIEGAITHPSPPSPWSPPPESPPSFSASASAAAARAAARLSLLLTADGSPPRRRLLLPSSTGHPMVPSPPTPGFSSPSSPTDTSRSCAPPPPVKQPPPPWPPPPPPPPHSHPSYLFTPGTDRLIDRTTDRPGGGG